MNMNGEAIAFLDAVDGNRAALRVEKRKHQFRGRAVGFAGDDAAESVFGLHHDDVAGIDREHRFCVGPVDIMEAALGLDREFVTFPGIAFGKAALRHDRTFEPGVIAHRAILRSSGPLE
jgi:hypothetical protein